MARATISVSSGSAWSAAPGQDEAWLNTRRTFVRSDCEQISAGNVSALKRHVLRRQRPDEPGSHCG